jgi:hypothetical protein
LEIRAEVIAELAASSQHRIESDGTIAELMTSLDNMTAERDAIQETLNRANGGPGSSRGVEDLVASLASAELEISLFQEQIDHLRREVVKSDRDRIVAEGRATTAEVARAEIVDELAFHASEFSTLVADFRGHLILVAAQRDYAFMDDFLFQGITDGFPFFEAGGLVPDRASLSVSFAGAVALLRVLLYWFFGGPEA